MEDGAGGIVGVWLSKEVVAMEVSSSWVVLPVVSGIGMDESAAGMTQPLMYDVVSVEVVVVVVMCIVMVS